MLRLGYLIKVRPISPIIIFEPKRIFRISFPKQTTTEHIITYVKAHLTGGPILR